MTTAFGALTMHRYVLEAGVIAANQVNGRPCLHGRSRQHINKKAQYNVP